MEILSIFAQNVRRHRIQQGMTQEKLADVAGLHVTYINAVERERRNISLENISRISTALGLDAYQLLLPINEEEKT